MLIAVKPLYTISENKEMLLHSFTDFSIHTESVRSGIASLSIKLKFFSNVCANALWSEHQHHTFTYFAAIGT